MDDLTAWLKDHHLSDETYQELLDIMSDNRNQLNIDESSLDEENVEIKFVFNLKRLIAEFLTNIYSKDEKFQSSALAYGVNSRDLELLSHSHYLITSIIYNSKTKVNGQISLELQQKYIENIIKIYEFLNSATVYVRQSSTIYQESIELLQDQLDLVLKAKKQQSNLNEV